MGPSGAVQRFIEIVNRWIDRKQVSHLLYPEKAKFCILPLSPYIMAPKKCAVLLGPDTPWLQPGFLARSRLKHPSFFNHLLCATRPSCVSDHTAAPAAVKD
eukprot:1157646-Pelagomonas_calceolata.AAC.6